MRKLFFVLLSVFVLSACHSDPFSKNLPKLNDKELTDYSRDLGKNYFYALSEQLDRATKEKDCPKMQSVAGELLAVTPYFSSNWNFGNAIFEGNLALAKCDVKEKKVDNALKHLNEAAKTPGSPQLNTFGPPYSDLSVLSDLLREGRKKEVLEFLASFKNFWDSEFSKDYFDFWNKEMDEGRVPTFNVHDSNDHPAEKKIIK